MIALVFAACGLAILLAGGALVARGRWAGGALVPRGRWTGDRPGWLMRTMVRAADGVRAARTMARPTAASLLLVGALLVVTVVPALAASPAPGTLSGDARSSGIPPSFIGQPVLAAVAVIALGVLTAAATTLYARGARRR